MHRMKELAAAAFGCMRPPRIEIRAAARERKTAMEIKTEKEGKNLTLALSGRLDTTSAPLLEAELRREISGVEMLVFDLEKLAYVSSAGLRVLLSAQKVMNRQGGMTLRHVDAGVQEVLDVTGFAEILTIEP